MVVPVPLPTAAGEIEAYWDFVELAITIDIIHAQPAEAVVCCYASLVVGRGRHGIAGRPEVFE